MIKRYEQSKSMHVALGFFKMVTKVTNKTMVRLQLSTKFDSKYQPKKHYMETVIDDVVVFSRLQPESDKHLIYFHGGAYVFKGAKIHFQFLNDVFEMNEVNIHYVDYPLAPDFIYSQITEITTSVVQQLITMFHVKHLYLGGDSAGGNLVFQILKSIDKTVYRGVLALSPWLDVSMSNKESLTITDDVFLDIDSVIECANLYSGGDIFVKEASPVHETFPGYSNILMYIGTSDILYPDTLIFEKNNPHIQLHIYDKCSHVFPLMMGTDERKAVLEDIQKWFKN